MRKGAKIGLGITILFVSVIVGIASIPDEVLNETTTAIENEAKTFSAPEKPEPAAQSTPATLEPAVQSTPETPELTTPETPEPDTPATPEPTEQESSEAENSETAENQPDESKGNVIRVKISDGVGTALS